MYISVQAWQRALKAAVRIATEGRSPQGPWAYVVDLGQLFLDSYIVTFNFKYTAPGDKYILRKALGYKWALHDKNACVDRDWYDAMLQVLDTSIPAPTLTGTFQDYVPPQRGPPHGEPRRWGVSQVPFSLNVDGTDYWVEPDTMFPEVPFVTPPADEDVHQLAWICQRVFLRDGL